MPTPIRKVLWRAVMALAAVVLGSAGAVVVGASPAFAAETASSAYSAPWKPRAASTCRNYAFLANTGDPTRVRAHGGVICTGFEGIIAPTASLSVNGSIKTSTGTTCRNTDRCFTKDIYVGNPAGTQKFCAAANGSADGFFNTYGALACIWV